MTGRGLNATERDTLINAAILAPSKYNAQPWLFRFKHRTIEVYRDPDRGLGAEDPDGRSTLIGVGAAVLNLRVAAASMGLGTFTQLLPDPDQPTLAGEVTVGSCSGDRVDMDIAAMYPYLSRRRTNRQPFEDRAVPAKVRKELEQAAAREGAALAWVEKPYRIGMLLSLASRSRFAEADDPRRLAVRRRWVGGERTREGIPSRCLGPRPAEALSPVRDLAVEPADKLRAEAQFEKRPTLAILSTSHNSPADWLRAGQALERVLLVAAAQGLSTSLLNEPLEHAHLQQQVRDPRTPWSASQAVLRFGYGPEVPPTPRRPAADFLLGEDVPADDERPNDDTD